jgi:cysteinyl-tRNA synthetase
VLGLLTRRNDQVPEEVLAMVEARQAARKAKDFKESDRLRDEITARGFILEDTPKGPKVRRA